MKHQEWVRRTSLLLAAVLAFAPATPAVARNAGRTADLKGKIDRVQAQRQKKIKQSDREAAAKRLEEQRQKVEAARAKAGQKSTTTLQKGTTTTTTRMGIAADVGATALTAPLPIPTGPGANGAVVVPDYFTTPNWAFSPPLRKFMDSLPGLGAGAKSTLNDYYIPFAVADTLTYPGSDYYEIELREYEHQFHRDLQPTLLRGYVQVNNGTANGANTVAPPPASYLGPVIVAQRDRPVRIKFTNKLPPGQGGNLRIPVDETIMGAGMGPLDALGNECDNTVEGADCAKFPQNRAAIHLHGGRTPWISDGTPFQWITPAEEQTPYPEGVSLENVPDMQNPGRGSTTYYYSNQQSARLMFYHDHAWGITRLNVLVGEAAGYLITDPHEQALLDKQLIPAEQIPLVIQDRTFVDADVIRETDPLWNWGSNPPGADGIVPPRTGDLWIPHVYMPAQNPYDISGTAAYGRWLYGPWFWPPTNDIKYPPTANPYYDPACESPDPDVFATCTTPGQPPLIPATPATSVGMETFFDTQTVNGVAFPFLEVEPKAYRFRVLNASNDRFVNLSLYEADPAQVAYDGRENTEIKMVDSYVGNWNPVQFPLWPGDGREGGVPDPTKAGPVMVQIANEGGFLPRPVVIKAQPIGYFTDPTAFNVGNVKDKAMLLGPAERSDLVIDFTQYAGKTLILYNDAPTAFPALDVRTDFYAGNPDFSETGGYGRVPPGKTEKEGVQIGYGPNTRTVMQIRVLPAATGTVIPFSLANLENEFAPKAATATEPAKPGFFETAQEPIIVGQSAYNGVYSNTTFPTNWPYWGVARIQDQTISYKTVAGDLVSALTLEPKGIHDEMGASFDKDYGRMSGNLGVEFPVFGNLNQNFTLYNFTDPSTEIVGEAITTLGDGTQIWKITHNGVDTHPIHFHIFDVQLVNRVGWDGQIRLPDPNEMGWKDTIRISPLEDTIVAMRPRPPALPFNIPDSRRPLNPGIPLHSEMGFTQIDPLTHEAPTTPYSNEITDFKWEYVWHCHILSHEEMDMMRPIILDVSSETPPAPTALIATANGGQVSVRWADPTPVNYVTREGFGQKKAEIGFRIERAPAGSSSFTKVGTALANATAFADAPPAVGAPYQYRVVAFNEAGETASVPVTVDAPPVAGVSPASLTFANQQVGTTSAAKNVTVTNTGLGTLVVTGVSFTGANAGDFVVASNGCTSVAPGGSCAVGVAFKPMGANARSATMTIGTSDPAHPAFTVALDGTGISASVTPSIASPAVVGTSVVFTAAAEGATGFQYRFQVRPPGATAYSTVQDYSPTATWTLAGNTQAVGTYTLAVDVRVGSAGARVAQAVISYTIRTAAATGVLVTTDKPSPQLIGTSVAFTAEGQGSSGYQYRFLLSADGVTYSVRQNWSPAATWTFTTPTPGNYKVLVEVRTSSLVARDAARVVSFTINPKPATGVLVTANPLSPSPVGTTVVLTAEGQGSTNYSYRFYLYNGTQFVLQQGWSPTATWTLPTGTAGSYKVLVEVRTTNTVNRDAATLFTYTVTPGA